MLFTIVNSIRSLPNFKVQAPSWCRILLSGLIVSPVLTLLAFNQPPSPAFKISPAPPWVKKYPLPELKKSYSPDLILVHMETQYNHITKESFNRNIVYLNNLQGLNRIKSFLVSYEPAFQEVTINKATIYRKNRVLQLENQLHVEHRLNEKQIGGEQYDGDADLFIFLDQVRIGDMVELAFTVKGVQPDLYGVLNIAHKFSLSELIGTSYLRVIGAPNKAINYSTPSKIKPEINYDAAENTLELIYVNKEADIRSPEIQTWVYDSSSWKECNEVNLRNFQLDVLPSKSIHNKVSLLTHKLGTNSEKIDAILSFTQGLFYLDYDLIEPKKPDVVLKQGFGDCKSKSLLTVKMLECINVQAWPVLVKSTGIEDRLLNTPTFFFDHCMVEFVMGKDTILFDPTIGPQSRSVYKKRVSTFKYGLRLTENTSGLSRFNENTYQKIQLKAIVSGEDDGLNPLAAKKGKHKSFFSGISSVHRMIFVAFSLSFVIPAFLIWRILRIKQKHKMHLKELTSQLERLK